MGRGSWAGGSNLLASSLVTEEGGAEGGQEGNLHLLDLSWQGRAVEAGQLVLGHCCRRRERRLRLESWVQ